MWCVDTQYPNCIWTDKGLKVGSLPQRLNDKMLAQNKLVITIGKLEEIFYLKSDRNRWRELLTRIREEKLSLLSIITRLGEVVH